MSLSPAAWSSNSPELSLRDGVVRAVFARTDEPGCTGSSDRTLYYFDSIDGTAWSSPQRMQSHGTCWYDGGALAVFGDTAIVVFDDGANVYARSH
jgi:hypothetical protein